MPNYLSITLLFLISVYSISHSIYVFKKGNHNPYLYAKDTKETKQTKKEKFVNFVLTMIVYWSLYTLITNMKPSFTIIMEFTLTISFLYTIFISILNYLTYKKIRERKIIYHTLILFGLNIALLLFMVTLDYNSVIGQKYEMNRLNQIEQIAIENLSLDGNTQSNINNYGLVAETNDSLFYIKDQAVCRADKDFSNQVVLFDQDSGEGKDTINVVGDWVFFRQGKAIKRMKNDGSHVERISSGYSLQMHVVGNWIYFINLSDSGKIYKMDINGRNKEALCDREVRDMTIYDGKIYYSYEYNKEGYLEVMNLDGTGKQLLFNLKARSMVVDKDYIYYLNYGDEKLYRANLKSKSIEELSNNQILKFGKDNNWIFYTLKAPKDSNWRFKGLYRMDIDGSNVLALDSESYLDELGLGISEDWVFYVSTNGTNFPALSKLKKDGTSDILRDAM